MEYLLTRDLECDDRGGRCGAAPYRVAGAIALAMLVAVAVMSLPAHADVLSFDDAQAYPVGENPKGLFAGDCDGDGTIDLLSANQNAGDLTTLRNDGSGAFEFGRTTTTGSQPAAAVCADLTGDGLVDLAAVHRESGLVTIYRRKETGGFTEHGSVPGGLLPTGLATGLVNGDALVDMVSVGSRSDDITVMLGSGSAALPAFVTVRVPIEEPQGVALADFNLDGHTDVAVVGLEEPFVDLLLGSSTGLAPRAPGSASPFAATRTPVAGRAVATADLNLDGTPDLALLSPDGLLSLYLGTGTGSFTFLDSLVVPGGAEALSLRDLNGDGLADLALAHTASNSVGVYLASGPGQFPLNASIVSPDTYNALSGTTSRSILLDPTDPESVRIQLLTVDHNGRSIDLIEQESLDTLGVSPLITLPDLPESVLLADMTNDGILDAVVSTDVRRGFPLRILRGLADGGFTPLAPTGDGICGDGVLEGAELCDDGNRRRRDGCDKTCVPEIKGSLAHVAATDVDGDGLGDLIVVDKRSVVVLLLGDGAGRFREVRILGKTRRKAPAAVADFTGDGAADVALIPKSRRDGALLLLVNDGLGDFLPIGVPGSARFTAPMLAGDYDGNGWLDLALGVRRGWTILYNDGDGPARLGAIVPAARGLSALGAADFDENGWMDVVATYTSRRSSSIVLHHGSSSGGFTSGDPLAVGGASHVFLLDLDADQHHDVVGCNPVAVPACRALYGLGDGTFSDTALPDEGSVGREVRAAAAADLDGDGEVDLVGISRQDNRGTILFRNPNRALRERFTLATGTKPADMALTDLDTNGIEDIIVANEGSGDLSIFMNFGQRQLPALAPVRLPAGSLGAPALASGDVDGDGRPDIAVSLSGSATVTLFLNVGSTLVMAGSYAVGAEPRDVALGHLNGDAVLDIVTANRGADTFSVLLSQPAGGYARTDYASAGLRPSSVAIDDLDGDLLSDVIIANEKVVSTSRLGSIATFLNEGAGTFGAATDVHIRGRETPRGVCTGDFDADGLRDAAVASLDTGDILVLHGDGAGSWRRDEIVFPIGQEAISVRCFDADGDGRTDIAFGRRKAGDVGAILTGD